MTTHMENLVVDMKAAAKKKKSSSRRRSNRGGGGGGGNKLANNEPMKVVYISNPIKFEIRASEFRTLVQELTGQDAEFPPSLHRRHHPATAASNSSLDNSSSSSSSSNSSAATVDSCVGGHHRAAPSPEGEGEDHDAPLQAGFGEAEEGHEGILLLGNEHLDECDDGGEFVPEMLENSAAFHSWHLDFDFAEWNG